MTDVERIIATMTPVELERYRDLGGHVTVAMAATALARVVKWSPVRAGVPTYVQSQPATLRGWKDQLVATGVPIRGGATPVLCVDTGERFPSLRSAANARAVGIRSIWKAAAYGTRCGGSRWEILGKEAA